MGHQMLDYRPEATVMDKTMTSDLSSDDKTIILAIEDASAEIGRVIEQMRRDQAEINQLKIETRAMLKQLKAA